MIQIRHNCFETNSSSANILIIPKDQWGKAPSRFFYMDDETSRKPSEFVIYRLIHGYDSWRTNSDAIDQIVNFLYLSGVEEIIYGGHDSYFEKAIQKYKDHPEDLGVPQGWNKEVFRLALFGSSSEVEHFSDGESRPNYGPGPEYKRLDEDEENYYREYYSDD